MRVPGIKSIAFTDVSAIGSDIEMQALAGMAIDISSIKFTPIEIINDPTLELSDSNEANGYNRKVNLSFVTIGAFCERRVAFIVTAANDSMYLIGSASSVPAISTKDLYSSPASTNNYCQVTIELTSPIAWMNVYGTFPIAGNEYPWREITEEEIDEIINNITA